MYEFSTDKYTEQKWFSIIVITLSICIAIFLIILIWTLRNSKLYLWDQGRYNTFQVLIFYILTITILLSRILQYFDCITAFSFIFKNLSNIWLDLYIYNFLYVVTMFLLVILGFY